MMVVMVVVVMLLLMLLLLCCCCSCCCSFVHQKGQAVKIQTRTRKRLFSSALYVALTQESARVQVKDAFEAQVINDEGRTHRYTTKAGFYLVVGPQGVCDSPLSRWFPREVLGRLPQMPPRYVASAK